MEGLREKREEKREKRRGGNRDKGQGQRSNVNRLFIQVSQVKLGAGIKA